MSHVHPHESCTFLPVRVLLKYNVTRGQQTNDNCVDCKAEQDSEFNFFQNFGQQVEKTNFKRTMLLNNRFDTKISNHHWMHSK